MRLWFFICLFAMGWAAPPPVPSAGVIERELQQEYEANPLEEKKETPHIQIDIPEERLAIPDQGCIEVQRIAVRGAESVKGVESWVAEFGGGQKLCLEEIYKICAKIDAEYAKRGFFLARSYPPPQTIENGVLVIQVIEGRLGNVKVEGEKFYSERFIRSYFTRLQGKSLNYDAFMRALLLLNENSDLSAAAVFSKGQEMGTADVIVRIQDKRPLHLYLNGNNFGKNITTNFRLGGRFDAGSVFTYGDKLAVAEVVGFPLNALYFTDVTYRAPVSRNGDFLEVAYLFSKFKVEELLSLHLRGESNIGTLKFTHALTRAREMSVDLFGYFDVKQIENFVLGSLTAFDKLRVVTVGSLVDRFASAGGRDYLNMRLAVGIPDCLGGMSAVSSQCSTPGAGGRFVKLNADYDHLQHLNGDFYLSLHASAQWSPYKLAIPEQIYIGGSDTVRGFPLAVALGNTGYYGNLELRFPPPILAKYRFFMSKRTWREVFQVVGFVDSGGVIAKGGSNTFLSGAGVGFRYKGPWNLSLSVDVGFPLNHRPLSNGTMVYVKATGQPF